MDFFSILLIETRYRLSKREIIARFALIEGNLKIELQKQLVEEKSRQITESIEYAKTIKDAMLPSLGSINEKILDSGIFY